MALHTTYYTTSILVIKHHRPDLDAKPWPAIFLIHVRVLERRVWHALGPPFPLGGVDLREEQHLVRGLVVLVVPLLVLVGAHLDGLGVVIRELERHPHNVVGAD
ncbi:uncharacterized protein PgNI_07286 [Pyricularia grisea]|uniref:Uncharacterized protein n=1 Tax=Pyricularia grisea TaxID=148305 RepID=A0A6P8B3T5_PYRGI|nr:uncharacterized protein PgNI_07286 [Pyricularia grisea]TLD09363.1 hypothetical protein PgNI_07286 [Pyricularia grisea]